MAGILIRRTERIAEPECKKNMSKEKIHKEIPEEKPKKSRLRNSQVQKLKEKVQQLENELAELKDKNLRLFAEFENFRKRTAKERLAMLETAGKDVILDLLPVLDDFNRSFSASENVTDIATSIEGYRLIYEKMNKVLAQRGLKVMESIGQKFDPEMHEALSELPVSKKAQKGKILDEIERGYYLNGHLLRHAKVVVGK